MLTGRVRYFLAVAEAGSFHAAASELGLAQPTLTNAIHKLELELGVELFERHARGVSLTELGRVYLRRARSVALEAEHAKAELAELQKGATQTLRIGAGPVWASCYLPKALAILAKRYPSLRANVHVGGSVFLEDMIRGGHADLCLGSIEERLIENMSDVTYEPLAVFKATAFVRSNHPAATIQREVLLCDLVSYPWIIFPTDADNIRNIHDRFRGEGEAPPRISLEASSILACLQMTHESDSILCLAEPLKDEAMLHGLTQIDVKLWKFKSGITVRAALANKPVVREFIKVLRRIT